MTRPYEPSFRDDLVDLTTIVGSALVAVAITGRLLLPWAPGPAQIVEAVPPTPPPAPVVEIDPLAGIDRVYGTVVIAHGAEVTGYIRWNDGAVSWTDVLAAIDPASGSATGVRFGHIESIRPVDARALRVSIKSGEVMDVSPVSARGSRDLGGIVIEGEGVGALEVPWPSIVSLDLRPEPSDRAPSAERVHGTLITRAGLGLTGYVTLSGEGGVLDDALGAGETPRVSFADVATIRALGPGLLGLTLHTGEERTLRSSDVGAALAGIVIADPALGAATVPWHRLRELRLHAPEDASRYESFDGGGALHGTVLTRGGEKLRGRIRWDLDESRSWQMLDGESGGAQLQVELEQVARIRRSRWGADVELRDGRHFHMESTNDVSWRNRGIEVVTAEGVRTVPWSDFAELRLDPEG